jgi:hypothetical protein
MSGIHPDLNTDATRCHRDSFGGTPLASDSPVIRRAQSCAPSVAPTSSCSSRVRKLEKMNLVRGESSVRGNLFKKKKIPLRLPSSSMARAVCAVSKERRGGRRHVPRRYQGMMRRALALAACSCLLRGRPRAWVASKRARAIFSLPPTRSMEPLARASARAMGRNFECGAVACATTGLLHLARVRAAGGRCES